MIKISNLSVDYRLGDRLIRALEDISLNIEENKSYAIIGESGSGKSTLGMSILRLLPQNSITQGNIYYKNNDIFKMNIDELNKIRWIELSVVFQSSMNQFSPVHRLKSQFRDIYKTHYNEGKNSEIDRRVEKLFNSFSLTNAHYNSYPHQLSGGMLQRANIVLSLFLNPSCVLFDEATTALDVINERAIFDEILEIEKTSKITRINITHDISLAYNYCERTIVLYGGYIMEEGDTHELFKNPIHPYTKLLIDLYPDYRKKGLEHRKISGNFSKKEVGCPFYERCNYKKDICKIERPLLRSRLERRFACHYPLGE